jgi:hypothetical protein
MPLETGGKEANAESSAVPGVLEMVEEAWDEIVLSWAAAKAERERAIARVMTEKRIEIP